MSRTITIALSVCLLVSLLGAPSASAIPKRVPMTDGLVAAQSSNPTFFRRAGNQLFFVANDGAHGNELWRTDGTPSGTSLVRDFVEGGGSSTLGFVGTVGNSMILVNHTARELWKSDGTAAGTVKLATLVEGSPSSVAFIAAAAGTRAYVMVRYGYEVPTDLWVTDGTPAGTKKVGSYRMPGVLMAGAAGKLVFISKDDNVGDQLWVSDGTALGTHMIFTGSQCTTAPCGPVPYDFYSFRDRVYFTTTDGLWKTDGTPAGTVKVATIGRPSLLASSETVAYFRDFNSTTVLRTDGTSVTTTPLFAPSGVVLQDGRLAFTTRPTSTSSELWRTDGTPAGTAKVAGSATGTTYDLLAAAGTRLFFSGTIKATGNELWSGDADLGNVALLADVDPRIQANGTASSSAPTGSTLNGNFIFAATDYRGRELWVSDGTNGGTRLLANIAADNAGGAISGTVTDAVSGAPLARVSMSLCDTVCTTLLTDDAGRYRFDAVVPGTYTVVAATRTHLAQAYDGHACPPCPIGTGTPLTVTSGTELSGVDFALARGGTISGNATRAADPSEQIDKIISVFDSNGQRVDRFEHNFVGPYTTAALPAGSYFVQVESAAWSQGMLVSQLYNGIDCAVTGCNPTSGTAVTVTTGTTTSGINFALHDFGRIAGTVRDASTGTPVPNLEVAFIRSDVMALVGATRTDSNGQYLSPGLYPGTYYVRTANDIGFPITYHPARPCATEPCDVSGATQVTVSAAATTSGIEIAVTPKVARITGVLRDAAGIALRNIEVLLLDANGYGIGSYRMLTDADGRYVFTGPTPGTYYVEYLGELAGNVICDTNPCNVAGATAAVLTANSTKVFDINAAGWRKTIVSGKVVDAATGQPAAGVSLTLLDQNGLTWTSGGASYNTGEYTLETLSKSLTSVSLIASSPVHHTTAYPNLVYDCTNTCAPPAGATAIAPGIHTGFDLTLVARGTIEGTVTNAQTGSPLNTVTISAVASSGQTVASVMTDASGKYSLHVTGSFYLSATAFNYHGQVYPGRDCGDACAPATGTLVTVADGAKVTGIDFALAPAKAYGSIAGRVIDAVTRAPVAGVSVTAYDEAGRTTSTVTDANGVYKIFSASYPATVSGTYRVIAHPQAPFYTARYGGSPCADYADCDRNAGAAVPVDAPATTSGIDFELIRVSINGISPAAGPPAGGTTITINGANFTQAATVKIGAQPATIVSITPTQIVAKTPAGAIGPAHVTVTLSLYLGVTLAHAFSYVSAPQFTDPTLTAGASIKAVHILELRSAVNSMRATASLSAFTFTDASLTGVRAKAVHLTELRTALDQARAAKGLAPLTYANAIAAGTRVRAADVVELRNGIQ